MNGGHYIKVSNLRRSFDISPPWIARMLAREKRRHLVAVDDVSFAIPRGQTYALVGESGSGKSTIARLIVGLDTPDGGDISIAGRALYGGNRNGQGKDKGNNKDGGIPRALRRKLQMVFQSPYSSLNPRWRVGDILLEPIRAFNLIEGEAARHNRVDELLLQVGLSAGDKGRYPHEFSGGQRQRISIARALASAPDFIVCDEPTSALDVSVQAQVLNLLKDLQKQLGLTYLFISHDMAVVKFMAHRIGVLKDGRLVEENTSKALFSAPRQDYTKMLMDATPRIN